MHLGVAVGTAILHDHQTIVGVRRIAHRRHNDPAGRMSQQDQGVNVMRPQNHLGIRAEERIDTVLDDYGLVGEQLYLGND